MANNIAELARKAQNVEELISLAKEAGIELMLEEAKSYFAQAAVSDQDLESVMGGTAATADETTDVNRHIVARW